MADTVEFSEKTGTLHVGFKGEIDTSAPFESVKEAASRFGGIGFWKPHLNPKENDTEEVDVMKVEHQAAQLERDLIAKERETLDVLKDLETTKLIVEELKLKIQKETYELGAAESDKENNGKLEAIHQNVTGGLNLCPSSAPGMILMELKQAKVNLTRTTSDLADIRASVDLYNKKIEEEKKALELTHQRLASNSSKISSLEKELNQTKQKLQSVTESEITGDSSENTMDISRELHKLTSEAEEFKKMGVSAKSEVLRAMSDIEQTRTRIKTAEIRLVAAKKMKQAARAAEKVALAEIKSLSSRESSSDLLQDSEKVTLSYEEYSSLAAKVREAEELANKRVEKAMLQVDDANVSKTGILKTVEEATEEIKTTRKALEEALNRVEAVNKGKLAVEEALRKWRSEHGQKRRPVHNSSKFKTTGPSYYRKEPRLRDVNGLNLVNGGSEPVLRPTLSIGQILSRKLLLPEEDYEPAIPSENCSRKSTSSLSQMLSTQKPDVSASGKGEDDQFSSNGEKENGHKQFSTKRKKFNFARFSILLAKQNKKKKNSSNFKYCPGQVN